MFVGHAEPTACRSTEWARRCGLSGSGRRWASWNSGSTRASHPALLSKIEHGKMFPTLPTLLRVALVFSVGLDYFFGGGQRRRRWRWSPRHGSPVVSEPRRSASSGLPLRMPRLPSHRTTAQRVPSCNSRRPAQNPPTRTEHDGAEIVFVISGTLAVTVSQTNTCCARATESISTRRRRTATAGWGSGSAQRWLSLPPEARDLRLWALGFWRPSFVFCLLSSEF